MDDTKLQEPVSSSASQTTSPTAEPAAETPAPVDASESPKNDPSTAASRYSPVRIAGPKTAESQLADFVAFLKRTWRVWAIAIGIFVGAILVIALLQKMTEMAKIAQRKRFDKAIASVTPDHLIARCGKPAEDVTREVFPVVMRTIRYQPSRNETLLLTFSKTAEQQSDWVFLAMKDESSAKSLDTTESKISALPCLDSTK
jgi:hypothetical protein